MEVEEVAQVLAHYDVGAALEVAPGGGTANANARITTEQGTFFLKRRNPKYANPDFVAFDHALMEHLAPHHVGTPLARHNRDSARWTTNKGLVYELFPLYPGLAHNSSSLPQLTSAGRALAAFHRATEDFKAPAGKDWSRYQDPAKIRAGLDELGDVLTPYLSAEDRHYLDAQVRMLENLFTDALYHALPKVIVHGDWHPGNALYGGDQVSGIFDLDWATYQPRVLDLADGLFLWAGTRESPLDATSIVSLTQTWQPSLARWRAFVSGYTEVGQITDREWDALLLTVRARWLFCRIGGRVKLPAESQAGFVAHRLLEPLRALDTLGSGEWR
jgi:homoserine kinase type II